MAQVKSLSKEQIKEKRKEIDALIQYFNNIWEVGEDTMASVPEKDLYNASQYQVSIYLTNAKMWLGKMLEAKGSELPEEFADKAK